MYEEVKNLGQLTEANSGKILGAMVKVLNLDEGFLKDRTARRFFSGHSINENNRAELFESIGAAFVERSLAPEPKFLRRYGTTMSQLIGQAVENASRRWDHLLAVAQSRSVAVVDISEASEQILRMVVVDLAVRVFAFMRLTGVKPSCPVTPLWAMRNGSREFLRELAKRSGMTREKLADRLQVSDTSVDNWLDGKVRPTPNNVAALAEAVAIEDSEATKRRIERQIHNTFTLAEIADLLAKYVGRKRVIEISTALNRFIWLITNEIDQTKRPPIEENPTADLVALVHGTAHQSARDLVLILAENEAHDSWRRIFVYATLDWDIAIQSITARSGLGRSAAGLSQDLQDIKSPEKTSCKSNFVPDPAHDAVQQLADEVDYSINEIASRGGLAGLAQSLRHGIDRRKAIVDKYPLSPLAHFQLGSFLGMVGKHMGRRDLVDEGIVECRISSLLKPDWDGPAVEPGIMLANIGAYEAAQSELRRAEENLAKPTPHLQFVKGYVLMELNQFEESLKLLENVLNVRHNYALALKFAARCAFHLGDRRKGLRYAKAARRHGEPSEYEAWKNGRYPSR